MLHKLNGAYVFSKIDLQNAFLPILKALTTITTSFGLFGYNFLQFGLSLSPSIFQKTINGIIRGIDGVVEITALKRVRKSQREISTQ